MLDIAQDAQHVLSHLIPVWNAPVGRLQEAVNSQSPWSGTVWPILEVINPCPKTLHTLRG